MEQAIGIFASLHVQPAGSVEPAHMARISCSSSKARYCFESACTAISNGLIAGSSRICLRRHRFSGDGSIFLIRVRKEWAGVLSSRSPVWAICAAYSRAFRRGYGILGLVACLAFSVKQQFPFRGCGIDRINMTVWDRRTAGDARRPACAIRHVGRGCRGRGAREPDRGRSR